MGGIMDFGFHYNEYNKREQNLSAVEEKIIAAQFDTVVNGNDLFNDKSKTEMQNMFWLFRHGWICRDMIDNKQINATKPARDDLS